MNVRRWPNVSPTDPPKDQAGKGQQIRIRDPLRCLEPNAQF